MLKILYVTHPKNWGFLAPVFIFLEQKLSDKKSIFCQAKIHTGGGEMASTHAPFPECNCYFIGEAERSELFGVEQNAV